jgi:signal transduction histidine kinase
MLWFRPEQARTITWRSHEVAAAVEIRDLVVDVILGMPMVGIILKLRNNEVTCIIEDDGRGIDGDPSKQSDPETKRLGLLGMRERLALVGGTLELEFTRGRGAAVFLRAPLPSSALAEGGT